VLFDVQACPVVDWVRCTVRVQAFIGRADRKGVQGATRVLRGLHSYVLCLGRSAVELCKFLEQRGCGVEHFVD
jgi:hypothetical protein